MIHTGFLQCATRAPHRTAIVYASERISYGQLLNRALRAAKLLDAQSNHSSRPIAIIGDKRIEAIEAILAVLLTGRAYSFLNPKQRRPRIQRMIESLRPSLLMDLGSSEFDHAPESICGNVPFMRWRDELPADPHEPQAYPSGAAYVLFTSGSTGHPQGVVVSHEAGTFAQQSFVQTLGLGQGDLVANEVALNFDVSTFDIFSTLSVGATLHVVPDSVLDAPTDFTDYLELNRITTLFTVPTVARELIDSCRGAVGKLRHLQRLLLTGELISGRLTSLMSPFIAEGRVWNLYGATEFPWGLSRRLLHTDVGNPNVLDVPPNSAPGTELLEDGELVIRGTGLFSEYVSANTDFSRMFSSRGMFRTGDYAERKGDEYRFLGRRDRQSRREGYRIELREIENWIETYPGVQSCYIVADSPDGGFTAFVIPRPETQMSFRGLKRHLRRGLPSYMFPDRFEFLSDGPRTSSGKKDYSRLRDRVAAAPSA